MFWVALAFALGILNVLVCRHLAQAYSEFREPDGWPTRYAQDPQLMLWDLEDVYGDPIVAMIMYKTLNRRGSEIGKKSGQLVPSLKGVI